jgi:membrane protein YdbS with pleckstrin-like domain
VPANNSRLIEGENLIWEGRPNWRAWAGMTILGFALIPAVVGLVILAVLEVRKRSLGWMISSRRIEVERGWLSKKVDTLELWRIKDVEFQQGLWERISGVSTIVITANDDKDPVVEIRGVPGGRSIYDQLSNAVMSARQQRGVMNLNQ